MLVRSGVLASAGLPAEAYERTLATTEGMLFLYQKYPKTEAVDLTNRNHHCRFMAQTLPCSN
jgi:hypothetical protein